MSISGWSSDVCSSGLRSRCSYEGEPDNRARDSRLPGDRIACLRQGIAPQEYERAIKGDPNPQNCERHIRDMRILLIPLRVTFLFDGPGTAFVVPGGQPKTAEAGDADRQTADSDRTEQDNAQHDKHCERHQTRKEEHN